MPHRRFPEAFVQVPQALLNLAGQYPGSVHCNVRPPRAKQLREEEDQTEFQRIEVALDDFWSGTSKGEKVLVCFQGHGGEIGVAVLSLESLVWRHNQQPYLTFAEYPPEMERLVGPRLWPSFVLAAAAVSENAQTFCVSHDAEQAFVRVFHAHGRDRTEHVFV